MKVGVFDSGMGGQSVARALAHAHPELDIVFRDDQAHLPYGNKSPEELIGFVVPILYDLVAEGCQLIIVACNTVTTTIISELRDTMPVPLVAVEPMVKPAAELTTTGVIAVCATPTTLASTRYAELKQEYASRLTVIEPDCSDWTTMIEANAVDHQRLATEINSALEANADVIVLGCTHYHWIEEDVAKIAGNKATVLQPEAAIIKQTEQVIQQINSGEY